MEKIMDGICGAIIFYICVAILTFAVTLCMKESRQSDEETEKTYVAYLETANSNL